MRQRKVPNWQKRIVHLFKPVITFSMQFMSNGSSAQAAQKAEEAVKATWAEVEDMLKDGRKFLMNTKKPTFLDFHFCSMAAILLLPTTYAGSALDPASRLGLSDLHDIQQRARIEEYRNTKVRVDNEKKIFGQSIFRAFSAKCWAFFVVFLNSISFPS
jgi:glutathione S-transferase